MKCLVYLFLILSAVVLASAKTSADSTGNLLSNNFQQDWTGTNDHYHGPTILAGVHNEYREQTITLSDHMDSIDIQGVTASEFTADIWIWNSFPQSVDMTQEITDSNGVEYTNTITISGTCNSWNGCGYEASPSNTIYITDVADDYDITTRFSFSVPSRPNYHYAADVKDPSLVVHYDPYTVDITTTQDVEDWLQEFEEEYVDIFEEQDLFFIEEPDPFIQEFLMYEPEIYELFEEIEYYEPEIEELPEEIIEEMPEEIMEEEIIEDMPEEIMEEVIEDLPEEIVDDEPEEISEEPTMQEEPEEIDAGGPEQGDIMIGKTVFAQAIEVDKVTLSIMLQEQPIMQDANFYAPINIYPDQITIFDDRQIYGNISYVANDPVTVHNNLIVGNLERQQELIQKLESMQWRN
tara:strand:+ start:1023 stop:2243 length:1221 start_codon:yes stop_codon:yes gene_type:complete